VARLAGRTVVVPAAGELVALGAALQATACLTGEAPEAVAERWGTRAGTRLDPPAEPDAATLERIRGVREAALSLLDPPS
jgi:xylulokinase